MTENMMLIKSKYVEYCPNQQMKAYCRKTEVKATSNCMQTRVKYIFIHFILFRLFSSCLPKHIEDNTWLRGDMKFIFECSTRYLTSERSERVRYRFEHEKINFISPSNHVLFSLFYNPTNNKVFDHFPKISDHFPKISEDFESVVRWSHKCF